MRTRVAISDWCASRNVVSVISSRFCERVHCANPSGPSSSSNCRVPCGGCAGIVRAARARARILRPARLARDFRIAVDDDVAQVGQQPRGAVAPRREMEQRGSLVEERRGDAAGLKRGVVDHVLEERNVRLHAADAELAQARSMRWQACGNSRPQAVTFTSSES